MRTEAEMSDPLERAEPLSDVVLNEMRRLGVAPTPDNYLIWYTHASGRDPELSKALCELESAEEAPTARRCSELYDQFFGRAQSARLIDQSCRQISTVMTRMLDHFDGLKADTGQYTAELATLDAHLADDPTVGELRDMVAGIMSATQAIQTRVQTLESECAGASDTITDLQSQLVHAQRAANTDALTEIANRRHLDERLEEALRRHGEDGEPLSFLLIDIDHFKTFNDTFGHQVGDRVLKLIGRTLTSCLKGRDLPARFGGEEFAVILPKTSLGDAIHVAEQIRATVGQSRLRLKSSGRDLGQLTISIGCAQADRDDGPESLTARADQALYDAKNGGRNRVCARSVAASIAA